MMKILLSIAGLLIALSFAVPASAEITKVRIGTEGAYPPFNSIDENGKLVGFDIEIGDALCTAMKVECEWTTSDWEWHHPRLAGKEI